MNKIIPRLVVSVALTLATITVAAAQFTVVDVTGQPFMTKSYTDVRGSAYLYDTWMKGSVTTDKGVTYEGIELMYDQVANELIFKSSSGETKTFVQPIIEFSIKTMKDEVMLKEQVFRKGFVPVDAASPETYYEVLTDGEAQLLKRTAKAIFEELPYGASSKVKTFQSEIHYYIAKNGKLIKIKKDKKSILRALSDEETEIEEYIKNKRIDLKKDEGLASLVAYYNSIK